MNKDELGLLYPIILEPYNPDWHIWYDKEKERLKTLIGSHIINIHHIGSTAINGIAAKPTVDILIEVDGKESTYKQISEILQANNYIKMEEQDNELMFVKGYLKDGFDKEVYHIHIGSIDQEWLFDRILFRDYLNLFRDVKFEYEALKYKLMKQYKHDREAYTEGKTEFINKMTSEAKKYYHK